MRRESGGQEVDERGENCQCGNGGGGRKEEI